MAPAEAEPDGAIRVKGRGQIDLDLSILQPAPGSYVVWRIDEPCSLAIADAAHHLADDWRIGGEHHQAARLDHPGLFARNGLEGVAEIGLMVEINGRDGDRDRRHDVGGVKAAAETDFEHGDVHAGISKNL